MINGSSKTLAIANDIYGGFTSVAISPTGQLVATGSIDKVHRLSNYLSDILRMPLSQVVCIWDARTGEVLERLRGDRNWVESVAFTPDGHGLVSCGWDKMVKYWDISRLAGGRGQQSMCTMNLAGHEVRVDIERAGLGCI